MIIPPHCFWELSTSLNIKLLSSMFSILQTQKQSLHNNLDNIDNLLIICYVLVIYTLIREREEEKEKRREERKKEKEEMEM